MSAGGVSGVLATPSVAVLAVLAGGHNTRVLRAESSAGPNAIADLLLHLRGTTDKRPSCYFGWTEGNVFV